MTFSRGDLLRNQRMELAYIKRKSRFRKYLGIESIAPPHMIPDVITEILYLEQMALTISLDLVEAKEKMLTVGRLEFFYDQVIRLVDQGWEWREIV